MTTNERRQANKKYVYAYRVMRASNFKVKKNNNEEALYPQNERPIYLDQSVLFVSRHSLAHVPSMSLCDQLELAH